MLKLLLAGLVLKTVLGKKEPTKTTTVAHLTITPIQPVNVHQSAGDDSVKN